MNLSNISSGEINYEQRKLNLNLIRLLYSFFAIELLIALIWTTFALIYPEFGNGIINWWEFAIVTGLICLILLIVSLFIPIVRRLPFNIIVYVIFVICFMHFISYLCLVDSSRLVYYALWLVFAVSLGFVIYAFSTVNYMKSINCLIVVSVSCLIVFVCFLIFSKVNFIGMVIVLLVVMVFGFYFNYDVRKMVRNDIYEYGNDDPLTGAVRIWGESLLVFCRFLELLGRGCCKSKS